MSERTDEITFQPDQGDIDIGVCAVAPKASRIDRDTWRDHDGTLITVGSWHHDGRSGIYMSDRIGTFLVEEHSVAVLIKSIARVAGYKVEITT